jgi:hypothetical protein
MEDSRRHFLKGILTVSGLAMTPMFQRDITLPDKIEADTTSYPAHTLKYKGFLIRWTGWKSGFNTDVQVAQWLAYEEPVGEKSRLFYASYPGREGQYYPEAIFDISIKTEQFGHVPTYITSLEDKQKYMLETLERLMRLIDANVAVAE